MLYLSEIRLIYLITYEIKRNIKMYISMKIKFLAAKAKNSSTNKTFGKALLRNSQTDKNMNYISFASCTTFDIYSFFSF